MGILQNENAIPSASGAGGFYDHTIEQSCRFDASASSRLYRTFGTSSDATKMTISWWMKYDIIPAYQQIFSKAGGYGAGNGASITFDSILFVAPLTVSVSILGFEKLALCLIHTRSGAKPTPVTALPSV